MSSYDRFILLLCDIARAFALLVGGLAVYTAGHLVRFDRWLNPREDTHANVVVLRQKRAENDGPEGDDDDDVNARI